MGQSWENHGKQWENHGKITLEILNADYQIVSWISTDGELDMAHRHLL